MLIFILFLSSFLLALVIIIIIFDLEIETWVLKSQKIKP